MNKTFNINLGGYPFTIDEDAYTHLEAYLKAIHKHFKQSEGYEEIVGDIENRLAELFQDGLGKRSIIIIKDVKTAISTMGTPEEFGTETESASTQKDGAKSKREYATGKRLFRNKEDELLGGVCAGIAAYFGIADPLWVRLFFVVITLGAGIGIIPYIVLWIIVPEAKTSSDRLAMRGEPINVSNIARIIEEELSHLTEKITELGSEFTSKKKNMTKKFIQEAPFRKGFLW